MTAAWLLLVAALGCAVEVGDEPIGAAEEALAPVPPPRPPGGVITLPLACMFDYREIERSTILCTYTGEAFVEWSSPIDTSMTSCSEYWSSSNGVPYLRYSVACNVKVRTTVSATATYQGRAGCDDTRGICPPHHSWDTVYSATIDGEGSCPASSGASLCFDAYWDRLHTGWRPGVGEPSRAPETIEALCCDRIYHGECAADLTWEDRLIFDSDDSFRTVRVPVCTVTLPACEEGSEPYTEYRDGNGTPYCYCDCRGIDPRPFARDFRSPP